MDLIIGTKVYLSSPLSYLKTNDPMPMLRPPDLVSLDEVGEVVGQVVGVDVGVVVGAEVGEVVEAILGEIDAADGLGAHGHGGW